MQIKKLTALASVLLLVACSPLQSSEAVILPALNSDWNTINDQFGKHKTEHFVNATLDLHNGQLSPRTTEKLMIFTLSTVNLQEKATGLEECHRIIKKALNSPDLPPQSQVAFATQLAIINHALKATP